MEYPNQNQPQQTFPPSATTHAAYATVLHLSKQESLVFNDVPQKNPSSSKGVVEYGNPEQEIQYIDYQNPGSSEGVNGAVYFENLQDLQYQAEFAALNNGDQNSPGSPGVDGINQGFPPGFRFCPYDSELIKDYLMKKIANPELNWDHIRDVNLYQYDPNELTAAYPGAQGDWYFFTSRDRKYRNGKRPNRATITGFWKATGADREIRDHDRNVIGKKRPLVYYEGKPRNRQESNRENKNEAKKTDWIMYEYQVHDAITSKYESPSKRNRSDFENDMRLDGYVLCKISRSGRSSKSQENEGSRDLAISTVGSRNIDNPRYSNQHDSISPSDDNRQSMDVADGLVARIGNFQAHFEPMVNPVNYNLWNQVDITPSYMQDNLSQADSKPTLMTDDILDLQGNICNMAAHRGFVYNADATAYEFASPVEDYVFMPHFSANLSASRSFDQDRCADKFSASNMDNPLPLKKN